MTASTQPESATVNAEPRAVDVDALAELEINARLPVAEKLRMYTDMVRIRRFEERCIRVYQQGKIGGFLHLYIGQEAVAVGAVSLLGADDHVITAYRDHGHALAVGMTMNECMAEIQGKYTGCSKGKGGSMHFFAPDKNYWGGHGIVGGQTPLGAGLAFALKYRKIKGCCLCFLGDGAVNQGVFHESLNLAALWDLPVIYIIENNLYSMGTSQSRSSAGEPLARRADPYDIPWDSANGNVLYDVRAKVSEAVKRAHSESRPSVLEIATYRYKGHSMSDPDKSYRDKAEVKNYRESKDPITLFGKRLISEGVIDEDTLQEIDKQAREEAETAARFADESPFPPEESITQDVYFHEDNPDTKNYSGRMIF